MSIVRGSAIRINSTMLLRNVCRLRASTVRATTSRNRISEASFARVMLSCVLINRTNCPTEVAIKCHDKSVHASRMTRDSSEKLVIGWNLIQAGDLAARPAAFPRADPGRAFARSSLVLAGLDQPASGKLGRALANYGQVLRLDPDHVQALNNLGVALQSQGMIAEAAACLRIAIQNQARLRRCPQQPGQLTQGSRKLGWCRLVLSNGHRDQSQLFRCV